ncbi:RluA family pseudouridine synthase [Erythrobacter sp. W53]|uniref:RluA family pseudouridine synthase n=1 Tax=Erythrobacter sp. W53 TaxID=3425947 RepID=UPI003D7696FB
MSEGAKKKTDPKKTDNVRQFTVSEDDNGVRLDRWFKRNLPQVGFGMVSRWARTGQLRVDGKRAKPEDRLTPGQILRVPPGGTDARRGSKPRRPLTKEEIAQARDMVIMETKSAIVLNKPPGLATQGGTKTTKHVDGLLDAFVEGETEEELENAIRPRLVHRLDKDTSGVLLVARTPGSAATFSRRFSGRTAKKIYWALVVGVPDVPEGTIDAPLAKQPGTGGEKMHVDMENGQSAKTRYRVVEKVGKSAAWLELQPLTGRTHQLRVHCEAIGHPIVGDGKYGGSEAFLTGAISRKMHLHARRLIIDGAEAGKIDVVAELPEHFANTMDQLGFDMSLGMAEPMRDDPPERSRSEKKQAARQHAKQYRKSRKGERRTRTKGPPAKGTSKKVGATSRRAAPKGRRK